MVNHLRPNGPNKGDERFSEAVLGSVKKSRFLLFPEPICMARVYIYIYIHIYIFRQDQVYQKSTHSSPRSKSIKNQYPSKPRDIAQCTMYIILRE